MSEIGVIVERVQAMGLTPTVENRLIGYLVQRSVGSPESPSPKYRKLARESGLADG